jgi:hypothetical protein
MKNITQPSFELNTKESLENLSHEQRMEIAEKARKLYWEIFKKEI